MSKPASRSAAAFSSSRALHQMKSTMSGWSMSSTTILAARRVLPPDLIVPAQASAPRMNETGPLARPPFLSGSIEPRMFDRLMPEPEPPRKILPSLVFQSRIESSSSCTEEAAAELRRLLPDLFITTGTELTREWHEFERTATAAANAYVGPQVSRYIAEFDAGLRNGGFAGSLLLMGSHGGVVSARPRSARADHAWWNRARSAAASVRPTMVATLGVENRGRLRHGRHHGEMRDDRARPLRGRVRSTISAAPIRASRSAGMSSTSSRSGPAAARSPGSMSSAGCNVGPRSAGSTPGPACYGRGGAEPTVTDANLVLGRLDPHNFLGGEMTLVSSAARDALSRRIAGPLGYARRRMRSRAPPKAC